GTAMRFLLVPLLLASLTRCCWAAGPPGSGPPPRFPTPTSEAAWQLLPRVDPPLPAWARMLAPAMPRTTASMLELDALHRARNPRGAALAGRLRWIAADAIGCEYGRRYAELDLKSAGVSEAEMGWLRAGRTEASSADRALYAWARKMSTEAHAITDEE